MEKEIFKEIDEVVKNQKDMNGFLVLKQVQLELHIKKLEKDVTGLIILQGLSAIALIVVAIWG